MKGLVLLVRNEKEQMELVQEYLLECLERQGQACCCKESRDLLNVIQSSNQNNASNLDLVNEIKKLQFIVERQALYLNETKTKSNNNIRLLYCQLTASQEKMNQLAEALSRNNKDELNENADFVFENVN